MTATAIDVHCDDVVAAMARIADGVVRTPCHESDALSELCGARIFTKAEYLQRTGSFKERGARNALLQMDPALRARGVVAASAGNHALALAYHGRDLGISVTVVMPRGAPLVKQVRCAHYGARVLLHGDTIADAKVKADDLSQSQGLTYVHGFNDAAIIAGAGTVGIEILEQVPDVEAIVTPVGGGGLIAGVALAVKVIALPKVMFAPAPATVVFTVRLPGTVSLFWNSTLSLVVRTVPVKLMPLAADENRLTAPSASM